MPTGRVEYDLTIQRHQVVEAAEENNWGRQGAPNFDCFQRGGDGKALTEVQVFYFDNGSVNSARIIDHPTGNSVPRLPAESPSNCAELADRRRIAA